MIYVEDQTLTLSYFFNCTLDLVRSHIHCTIQPTFVLPLLLNDHAVPNFIRPRLSCLCHTVLSGGIAEISRGLVILTTCSVPARGKPIDQVAMDNFWAKSDEAER